jgi:hypothetical protein
LSKESRRRQRAANAPTARPSSGSSGPSSSGPSSSSTTAHGSTSATGTARAGRRDRSRPTTPPSFLERYRTALVAVAVIAVIGVVGIGVFAASTQPAYACSNQWVPDPTTAPAGGATPQPGYAQPDMGQGHLSNGTPVTYTYCPPASGKHYNGTQTGPISARVYGPTDTVIPQGWIHNLEHGAMIVLYRGDSEGATEAGQAAMRAFFDSYPASPVCGFQPGTSVGPVFARFDDMATPFTAMVWGRVLPLETFDTEAILELDRTFGERTNPESFCERPSPSPSAAPSDAASPSPSAS